MKEYIDRSLIEWYGCDFEDDSCKNRECSGCSYAECSHAQVMQIPTVNVVEREKLDKAIEEMKLEYYNLDSCENRLIASYWIEKSIKILKRNIGD